MGLVRDVGGGKFVKGEDMVGEGGSGVEVSATSPVCKPRWFLCFVGRADPKCSLGHVLKALFKNDNFMNKVGIMLSTTYYT